MAVILLIFVVLLAPHGLNNLSLSEFGEYLSRALLLLRLSVYLEFIYLNSTTRHYF